MDEKIGWQGFSTSRVVAELVVIFTLLEAIRKIKGLSGARKSPNMSKTVIVARQPCKWCFSIETTAPNGEISLGARVSCVLVDLRTFSVGLY